MTNGVLGGGVIFVVAALLWAAVLVPGWMRRREFRAAEQNAIRLQRTLRVLAETAEIPTEVRVEATAREALAQERILRTAQRRQEAERKAQLAEARAAQVRAEMRAQQMKRKQAALVRSAKLRRPWVRRFRVLAALAFVLGFVAALVGAGLAIAGIGFTVLLSAIATAVAGLGALVALAPGRVKLREIDAEHFVEVQRAPAPQPVQQDLAEDHAAAAHAAAQAAAALRIDRARAMARARAREVHAAAGSSEMQNQPHSMLLQQAREQVRIDRVNAEERGAAVPTRTKPQSTSERLRQMGVVSDAADGMLDLDAALKTRRRAS